jgi:hypothetical protein
LLESAIFIKNISALTIFSLQLLEWIGMLNVIRAQHHKTVAEINYRLSNNRDNNGRKLTFHRNEKILRFCFIVALAGILGGYCLIQFVFKTSSGTEIRIALLISYLVVFPTLMYMLYYYHWYEFKTNKAHTFMYFLIFITF